MISIKVNVLGKAYQLKVPSGEERIMEEIADFVNTRFSDFRKELQGQPESTITALAALSIAEDLYLEKRKPKTESGDQSQIQQRLQKLLADIKSANSDI